MPIDVVFDNVPGRIFHGKIIGIPKGIGQGQIAVAGILDRTNALVGATEFPAEISIPEGVNRDTLRVLVTLAIRKRTFEAHTCMPAKGPNRTSVDASGGWRS